jgi:hypothetical protein
MFQHNDATLSIFQKNTKTAIARKQSKCSSCNQPGHNKRSCQTNSHSFIPRSFECDNVVAVSAPPKPPTTKNASTSTSTSTSDKKISTDVIKVKSRGCQADIKPPKDECPICLCDIKHNKNSVILKCGHKFCSDCIFKTYASDGDNACCCPLCRKKFAKPVKKVAYGYKQYSDAGKIISEEVMYEDHVHYDCIPGDHPVAQGTEGEIQAHLIQVQQERIEIARDNYREYSERNGELKTTYLRLMDLIRDKCGTKRIFNRAEKLIESLMEEVSKEVFFVLNEN